MARKTILTLLALCCLSVAQGQPYWNNLEVYRLNKVQPHDRIIPEGPWRISLNGTWRFRYFDNPAQATITPSRWDSIKVPGNGLLKMRITLKNLSGEIRVRNPRAKVDLPRTPKKKKKKKK